MFDEVEQIVRSRQPDYEPEQSMSGNNTYSRHCEVVGWRPGYCVCLHKLNAYERDGSLKMYPECETGIRNKECQAIGMREMERAAGKSLFYVDRSLLREEMDKRFAASREAIRKEWGMGSTPSKSPVKRTTTPTVTPKPVAAPAPAPAKKQELFDEENGYAAAINAAIREAQQAPAAESEPEPKPEPKPAPKVESPSPSPVKKGLSLLEIARAQMGK